MLNTENDKFECRISNIELEDDVRGSVYNRAQENFF